MLTKPSFYNKFHKSLFFVLNELWNSITDERVLQNIENQGKEPTGEDFKTDDDL
jgi:hypothetical protein